MTRVVNCKRQPFDIYIGRPSKYRNPYRIREPHPDTGKPITRKDALSLYEDLINGTRTFPGWNGFTCEEVIEDLDGKTLGCWCKPLD